MKNIITLTSLIILIITSFLVLKYYYIHYWNYMYNTNTKWNKHIEKPRLAIYSITIPLILLFFKEIITQNYDYSFLNLLKVFSTVIIFLIMILITIIMLRDSLVTKFVPLIQRNNFTKNNNIPDSIIKEDENLIESSFNAFNHKYFKGNFETYIALINYTPLGSNQEKLVWINKKGKTNNRNNTSNIRTLIEFISIFYETDENQTIENIINEYFIDTNNKNFIINNSISKWKKDKANYLVMIRSDIKTILKFE